MRKSNAKDRILSTAGELFFRHGYSEVGINEIIEKAETAKASFYQHFPSKQALCEAWLESVHDRSEDTRTAIIESLDDPADKIERYFDDLHSFMVNSEFRGCPYSNTGAVSDESCTGIFSQIVGHKESLREFFRTICEQKFGETEEASEAGDRIFLLYSGATTEAQNLRALWPVEVAKRTASGLMRP